MKQALLVFFLGTFFWSYGQQKTITLQWPDDQTKKSAVPKLNSIDEILNFNLDEDWGVVYNERWEISGTIAPTSIQIQNVVYESVPGYLVQLINNIKIPTQLQYSINTGKARSQYYAQLELSPFIRVNGQVQRVKSFNAIYTYRSSGTINPEGEGRLCPLQILYCPVVLFFDFM